MLHFNNNQPMGSPTFQPTHPFMTQPQDCDLIPCELTSKDLTDPMINVLTHKKFFKIVLFRPNSLQKMVSHLEIPYAMF